jgi:hypothetical protein
LGDCGQGGNGLIQALLHLVHRLIAALQFLPQLLNLLLLAFQGPLFADFVDGPRSCLVQADGNLKDKECCLQLITAR